MNRSIKYAFLFFCFNIGLCFVVLNHALAKPKKSRQKAKKRKSKGKTSKTKQKKAKQNYHQKRNKDKFDEIKNFESYDPATGKWSKIEDFETVEILKDNSIDRKEDYVYQSFWAYDPKTKRWYKVDISNFGYKVPPPSLWSKIAKNMAFDIGYGPEIGIHHMFVFGKSITVTNDFTDELFISDKNGKLDQFRIMFLSVSKAKSNKKNTLSKRRSPNISRVSIESINGINFLIPISTHLHYTFEQPRIRIGFGCTFAMSFMNKLKVTYVNGSKAEAISRDRTQKKGPFVKTPNFILKPFLSTGWIINKGLINHFLIDFRLGSSIYLSQSSAGSFFAVNNDFGISYERRMGNYARFFARLGTGFEITPIGIQQFKSKKKGLTTNGSLHSMVLPSVSFQVGFGSYFSKDKKVDKVFKKLYKDRKKRRTAARKKAKLNARRKKLKSRQRNRAKKIKKKLKRN